MTPSEVHFYISLPHTKEDIEKLVEASEEFLNEEVEN